MKVTLLDTENSMVVFKPKKWVIATAFLTAISAAIYVYKTEKNALQLECEKEEKENC